MAESSTVTLLFTDIVGSTELLDRLGDNTVDDLRRRHFQMLGDAIAAAGGRQVKRLGDGVMAVFASAVDAVSCAVAIQRAVGEPATSNPDTAQAFVLRVGLNAGEVTSEDDDYYGTAVNVAARLCQAATAGQILASDLVRGLAGNRGGHQFSSVGNLSLKGLSEPVRAWDVGWRPDSRPSEGDVGLHGGRLGAQQFLDPLAWLLRTPFVGRADDLARLHDEWTDAKAAGRGWC